MACVAIGLGAGSLPAVAQAQDDDARLRKIEAEVRALQRKVFPNGDGRFFTPEVLTPTPAPSQSAAAPSPTVITDILTRLDALEGQLARLTARGEENANAIAQLQQQMNVSASTNTSTAFTPQSAASQPTGVIPAPGKPQAQAPAQQQVAAAAPSAARVAAVQAIPKPQTDDAGDDEYVYGFRLWDAGFFPEAQQQLALFVKNYPNHSRITYGRNLLGRAYLDDGKAEQAAPYFLSNYQADKQAARAPDSLLYLSEAMIAMGDTKRACIALAEFGDTYPALATGRLQGQYERDRSRVKCQ
ncbi:hypothetical protein GRI91_12675 [Altererythrobacter endophyticus]|uniref:Tetratricopeptide repeat protein n=2 Tax=Altericroceibacterium endophyticum TaxID=1808508 RepID=A0A6I4T9D5_9SPHN|nr:hypothetical protein [Altericroceibacterium endophyticum]MXO66613.1 hypothetical protein [Altericroceibacterium endophyticum]